MHEPPITDDAPVDRAIIQRLVVSNYRSLGRDVALTLGPLTLLVGPNGSGKSNVVDALHFVRDCMEMGLGGAINDRNGIEACRRWNRSHGGHPYNVSFRLELALPRGHAIYEFELAGSTVAEYCIKSERAVVYDDGRELLLQVEGGKLLAAPEGLAPAVDDQNLVLPLIGGDLRFRPLFRALRNIAVYSIYPNELRRPQKYSASKPMAKHGDNWVSILKDQPESTWKPELVAALNKLTGDIGDIEIKRAAGYLVVRFRRTIDKKLTTAGKWFEAYQESDGTLRVAGIITALLQEPPVPVIAIEEPELTVHPGAIPLVADFLIQASRRSQVLVTTHSPELLDCVDASAVRVVSRSPERGTMVSPMSATQGEAVRRGLLSLGEVLRLEGLMAPPLQPLDGEEAAQRIHEGAPEFWAALRPGWLAPRAAQLGLQPGTSWSSQMVLWGNQEDEYLSENYEDGKIQDAGCDMSNSKYCLPAESAWRLFKILEELNAFLHNTGHFQDPNHVEKWLKNGVYAEVSHAYYEIVGPWFPVEEVTGEVQPPPEILATSGKSAGRKALPSTKSSIHAESPPPSHREGPALTDGVVKARRKR